MERNSNLHHPARFWRRSTMVIALFATIYLAGGSLAVAAANPEVTAAATPTSSSNATTNVAVCVALDASGSNFAVDGTWPPSDPGPVSARAGAVESLASLLGGDQLTSHATVAVAFFGQDTLLISGVDATSAAARTALSQRLEALARVDLGWTRLTLGLDRCRAILTAAAPGVRRLLVVISDFVAQDADPHYTFAAQRAAITSTLLPALAADHITVAGIGYGDAVRVPHSPFATLLASIASATGGQSVLVDPSHASILTAVGSLLARFLGTTFTPGVTQIGVAGTPLTFTVEVPPQTSQTIFTVEHADAAADLLVTAPDGTTSSPALDPADWSSGAGFSQFLTNTPTAGTWTVAVTGTGLVRLDVWLRAITPDALPTPSTTPTVTAAPIITPLPPTSMPVVAPSPAPPTSMPAPVVPVPSPSPTPPNRPTATPATATSSAADTGEPGGLANGWLLGLLLGLLLIGCGGLWFRHVRTGRPVPGLVGALTVEEPGGLARDITLAGGTMIVGSADDSDIHLSDPGVADYHATLTAESGPWEMGVRLTPAGGDVRRNGEPVPRAGLLLADGDELHLGMTRLLYRHLSA